MTRINPSFRVAGVTKENDEGKDIQSLLKRLSAGYKKNEYIESWNGMTKREMLEDGYEGFEFESEPIRNIIRLEREPDNPHDPNAVKVFMKDVNDGEHHVGYIKREDTEKVVALTHDTDVIGIEVEFTGGKRRTIEYDSVSDDEYFGEDELTRGLELTFIYRREQQQIPSSNKKTDKKTKEQKREAQVQLGGAMQDAGKAMSGCGCLLTLLITIPILIIIIFFFL